MDFDLSPDQVALREAAAALLQGLAPLEAVKARVGGAAGTESSGADLEPVGAEPPAGYDRSLWEGLAEQGWLGVERPVAEGGLGLSMVEIAVLCEQLGRHVAPAPFLETVLARKALDPAARDGGPLADLVRHLDEGTLTAALAWPPEAVAASGPPDAQGRVALTGTPDPVPYGPSAAVIVVAAADGLYAVVPEDIERPRPEPAMDRTRELGWLRLRETPGWRVGDVSATAQLLDRVSTALAAALLGVAERALEMAVAYAKERVQFGRPIGSFQAVKHRLADALVDVEGMRSTAYYAAWCTATGDPEAPLAASMAKAWCADAARRVGAASLQVHGGIGFTWEHPLHLYLKRAQLDQVTFGDAAWHRDRLATALRQRVAKGEPVL